MSFETISTVYTMPLKFLKNFQHKINFRTSKTYEFSFFFTGKMFKSAELPWLITFFQMFYNDKPVDWLLEHLIYTKVCNWEKDMVSCKKNTIFYCKRFGI